MSNQASCCFQMDLFMFNSHDDSPHWIAPVYLCVILQWQSIINYFIYDCSDLIPKVLHFLYGWPVPWWWQGVPKMKLLIDAKLTTTSHLLLLQLGTQFLNQFSLCFSKLSLISIYSYRMQLCGPNKILRDALVDLLS